MEGMESLLDLALVMDANLECGAPMEPQRCEHAAEEEQQQQGADKEVENASCPHFAPCANVASLSLALGSMMSSNFVLSKVGVLPRRSSAKPVAAKPALPSQKKSHAPNPVTPSAKFKFGLDVEAQGATSSSAVKLSKSATAFPDFQMLPRSGKVYGSPAGGAAMKKASIVWFRNDLRVHDNEALASANKESLSVIPVYCFDPRDYGKSSAGFDKTGPYRAKFLLECVSSLRDSLRDRGSELVVRVGKPEEVLSTIAKAVGADGLYAHQEVSVEEQAMEDRIAASLKDQGVDVKYFWGSTLFHVDDLPFKLEEMPSTYGAFRDRVKNVSVRPSADAGKQLKGLPSQGDIKAGAIPTLQELGLTPSAATVQDKSAAGKGAALVGGEKEALTRLRKFSTEGPVKNKVSGSETKGENLYGANFSCKISPWLAMGCLSPRKMFEDLQKNTANRFKMQGTQQSGDKPGLQWLVCELLWRDFFKFVTKKYGDAKKNQTTAAPAFAAAM